jgi:hypothetical protein
MEILVRRALYPLLHDGQQWHKGLKDGDGIQILQPPPTQRLISMVEVITHSGTLAPLVAATLRPLLKGASPRADLLVVAHDADAGVEAAIRAIEAVNRDFNASVPLLMPVPEIQAWLTRKRSIEQAYERPFCSVPEPDEQKLMQDAKAELQRLLKPFGKMDARRQALMAMFISPQELEQYEWTGWHKVPGQLQAALEAERAHQSERLLGGMRE